MQVKYYMLCGEPVLAIIKAKAEWDCDRAVIFDSVEGQTKIMSLRYNKMMPVLNLSTHLKTKLIAGLAHLYKPEDLYHQLKQRQLIN